MCTDISSSWHNVECAVLIATNQTTYSHLTSTATANIPQSMAVVDAVSIAACAVIITNEAADMVAWGGNNRSGSGIGIGDIAV